MPVYQVRDAVTGSALAGGHWLSLDEAAGVVEGYALAWPPHAGVIAVSADEAGRQVPGPGTASPLAGAELAARLRGQAGLGRRSRGELLPEGPAPEAAGGQPGGEPLAGWERDLLEGNGQVPPGEGTGGGADGGPA